MSGFPVSTKRAKQKAGVIGAINSVGKLTVSQFFYSN